MSFSSGVFHNIVGFSTKLSHKTNCFLVRLLASASNADVKQTRRWEQYNKGNGFKKQNKNSYCAAHFLTVFYSCHCTTMVVKLDHKIATVSHLDFSCVNTVQCERNEVTVRHGEMIANAQQRKKSFEKNIFKFFLERTSICNFCCAANQNNPRKYVSYDRSQQPCGKFFSWASPIPLGNFYPLAPPPPRNFH